MSEGNKSSYVVMGHINLHKSNVCGTDFVKYLSDLYPSFRLNRNGHVLGMEKYGYNSREARKKFSLPGKDYIDPVVVMASTSNSSRSSLPGLKGVGRSALRKTDTKGSTNDTNFSNGANYGLSFSIIGM